MEEEVTQLLGRTRYERRSGVDANSGSRKSVTQLLPELYLHGLSQGDFELALRGLLGEGAPLSSSVHCPSAR